MSEPISPEQKEPSTLGALLAQFIARHKPGSRLHVLGTDLLRAHGVNRDRRAAVLKHKDLARRLAAELGYANPQQWNGYIPPAVTDPGGDERLCASPAAGGRGDIRYRLNQLGRYAIGEQPNTSPRRGLLLEISQEAWNREQAARQEAP